MTEWQDIIGKIVGAGAPTLGAALGGAIGGPLGGSVGGALGQAIGDALGVPATPGAIGGAIDADPAKAGEVLARLEGERKSEWVAYLQAATAMQAEMARIELTSHSTFRAGWRPALMWLVGFLVVWAWVLVPLINAATGAAIVAPEAANLITFVGLAMGLYMGGHTVKDVVSSWAQAKGVK